MIDRLAKSRSKTMKEGFASMVLVSLLAFGGFVRAYADGGAEKVEFEGKEFRVVKIDPKQQKLELMWKGADGQPLKTFQAVDAALQTGGRQLAIAMNAGIYEPGQVPSGLHIEKGKTLVPLNLKNGEGNFYLKPNGVFFLNADGSAGVMEAAAYGAAGKTPQLAVQSGPVLLVDGKIHPAFNDGSPNVRFRNGIGADSDGKLVMANSVVREGNDVNFHTFARLFRDRLGCASALFLDGDISELYVRSADGEVPKAKNWFAAMFVVAEKAGAEGKPSDAAQAVKPQ
jgi:uncharacterized protein YigE (DUF2233 family)